MAEAESEPERKILQFPLDRVMHAPQSGADQALERDKTRERLQAKIERYKRLVYYFPRNLSYARLYEQAKQALQDYEQDLASRDRGQGQVCEQEALFEPAKIVRLDSSAIRGKP